MEIMGAIEAEASGFAGRPHDGLYTSPFGTRLTYAGLGDYVLGRTRNPPA